MGAPNIDMSGKSVMITGATAGIGEAAAFALAEMGADLTIVCRNTSKGERVLAEIQKRSAGGAASMLVGDLGVQADIQRVADEFLATSKPLMFYSTMQASLSSIVRRRLTATRRPSRSIIWVRFC